MIFLHIETKPQEHIDTDTAEILCIGIKQLGGSTKIYEGIEWFANDKVTNILHQLPIIGFNTKKFVIPVLIKAGIKGAVQLPYARLFNATKPFGWADRSIDLMETLSFGREWKSIEFYQKEYCGLDMKKEDDPSIRCEQNLNAIAEIYLKFNPLFPSYE